MDRPVTLQMQRKRRYRRLVLLLLAALGFLLCVWLVYRALSTSIDADRLRTSVAALQQSRSTRQNDRIPYPTTDVAGAVTQVHVHVVRALMVGKR